MGVPPPPGLASVLQFLIQLFFDCLLCAGCFARQPWYVKKNSLRNLPKHRGIKHVAMSKTEDDLQILNLHNGCAAETKEKSEV